MRTSPRTGDFRLWHTGGMRTRAIAVALAAVAATGFGLAAQAQKPAASAVSKVVVYKSPT